MKSIIQEVFEREVKPVTGCTEAATVALVSSLAINAGLNNLREGFETIKRIRAKDVASVNRLSLTLDPYIFKNAFEVGIPRTRGGRGIKLAATLGLFSDPKNGLGIFDSLKEYHLKMARGLKIPIQTKIKSGDERPEIYAEARIELEKNGWGRVIIQHEHDKVVLIESNEKTLFKGNEKERKTTDEYKRKFKNLALNDLIDYVFDLPDKVVRKVKNGIELIKELSDEGLKNPLGMGVGYGLRKKVDDVSFFMKARVASAIDARMFGSQIPSMTVAGSGNQGIVATMPVYAYHERNQIDEDLLISSVTLSYLVTIYASYHSSYLSAICNLGFKAGIGSSAGLAYYMSGGEERFVKMAIQNFIANMPGMICDGAKYSCALKGATASDAIYQSALLALGNIEPPHMNGILGKNAEDSIRNLGEIFKKAQPLNESTVKIIANKQAFKGLVEKYIVKRDKKIIVRGET